MSRSASGLDRGSALTTTKNVRCWWRSTERSTKPDQHVSIACDASLRKRQRAPAFNDLLHRHSTASPAERATIEPVVFSKTVDYRRDVKRRKIAADAATDELLRKYKPEHVKRKRKK
jgi:hypothetical protein